MDKMIVKKLQSLVEGESNFIANASNFSALIFDEWQDLNWVGFYMYDSNELVLSTFQGKAACLRIPIGKGVCGTAFDKNETLIVGDVHEFPGHIACDSASNSEIVVPIEYKGNLIGVLDIDSPIKNRFSKEEELVLKEMLKVLKKASDLDKILEYYN
jgi:L-methionine (R)-S-oxide reductase